MQTCDGCNRPAHEPSAFEGDRVCCQACDDERGRHTPDCERRIGNRCEIAFGYLAWLAH